MEIVFCFFFLEKNKIIKSNIMNAYVLGNFFFAIFFF